MNWYYDDDFEGVEEFTPEEERVLDLLREMGYDD